jgi:hypothetical protein
MALKADRYEARTDISFYYSQGVADRGGVVVHGATAGSGATMDQGVNLARYKAVTGGDIPLGILLNDVVNKDLTRSHLNVYKDEVQLGGKVTILRGGYVVTNMIDNVSVTAGQVAYASSVNAGNISNSGVAAFAIGRFLSSKDADGYAKVEVNLPLIS